MSSFIPYTDEQITRANNTDIPALLQSIGHTVKREGNNWRWVSGHDSLMIQGNAWYRNSTQSGGGGVANFCKQYLDMDFKAAVAFLLNGEHGMEFQQVAPKQECERHFELPAANKNMRRVFAYLAKERCIDPEILSHFAHAKKIYEDADHHNAVFVGRDEHGIARFACKRGTNSYAAPFRRDVAGSDKRYAFGHAGTSGKVHVFEAPIDLLSYVSLHKQNWQCDSYIALGGVAAVGLNHFLERNSNVREVCLCLDNDRAGHEAIQRIGKDLQNRGYEVSAYLPCFKDWNEQIKQAQEQMQSQTREPERVNAQALTFKR